MRPKVLGSHELSSCRDEQMASDGRDDDDDDDYGSQLRGTKEMMAP